MSSIIEVEHLRVLELVGADSWKGVRSFLTYAPNAAGYMQAFRNQPFPNVPGRNAPRVRRTRALFNPGGQRGRALLMSWYETLRTPKKARIYVKTTDRPTRLTKDLDGKTLEGPDQHSTKGKKPDGIHAWQLTKGTALQLNPYAVVRAETAYYAARFRLADVMPIIGATNRQRLPNFGNAAKGTMRLMRVGTDWQWGDELIYINYDLQWSGPDETWNDTIEAQKGRWLVVEEPRWQWNLTTGHLDKLAIDDPVLKFVPGKETYTVKEADGTLVEKVRDVKPEARRLFPEKDFSLLRSLTVWS